MPRLNPPPARPAEGSRVLHAARLGYRSVRGLKNRIANLLDPPIVVLVYHRVADLESDPEMLAVSPGNFRAQLEYLKRNWRIVRFEEDCSSLKEPAVAVTFDDGYVDNLREALPILEQVGVPATFFVSTGQLGTGHIFWWHHLEEILLGNKDLPPRFSLRDEHFGEDWSTATPEQRRKLYDIMIQLIHKVGPDRREKWISQLRDWSGREIETESLHRSMSPEELRMLAASPWTTIGAHTVTHSALSALNDSQQRTEIFDSKRSLEEILGEPVTTFSYPFGRRVDYNGTSVRICREAGFTKVASNFPGQVHRWTDPMQLPRHLVRDWDERAFAAEMRSFWTR